MTFDQNRTDGMKYQFQDDLTYDQFVDCMYAMVFARNDYRHYGDDAKAQQQQLELDGFMRKHSILKARHFALTNCDRP